MQHTPEIRNMELTIDVRWMDGTSHGWVACVCDSPSEVTSKCQYLGVQFFRLYVCARALPAIRASFANRSTCGA